MRKRPFQRYVGALYSRKVKLMIGKVIADAMPDNTPQKTAAKMMGIDRQLMAYTERMALFKVYAALTIKHKLREL